MFERTNPLLTGAAIDVELQMQRFRRECFAPGDVRRSEQRDDRDTKRRCKMPGTRIGRDQQLTGLDRRLGQSEAQRHIGQRHNMGMIGTAHNFAGCLDFRWSAQHQHALVEIAGDAVPRSLDELPVLAAAAVPAPSSNSQCATRSARAGPPASVMTATTDPMPHISRSEFITALF